MTSNRKDRLIFLEGAQFAACLFLRVSKNIPPNRMSERHTAVIFYCLYAVLFFIVSTFPSVACFRCRLHFKVQTWKWKGFRAEYARCGARGRFRPKQLAAWPFNFQWRSVLPSQTSKGNGRLTESGIISHSENWIETGIIRMKPENIDVFLSVQKKNIPLWTDELYITQFM